MIVILIGAFLFVVVLVLSRVGKADSRVVDPDKTENSFPPDGFYATLSEKYEQNTGRTHSGPYRGMVYWLMFEDDSGHLWTLSAPVWIYNQIEPETRDFLRADVTGKRLAQFGDLIDPTAETEPLLGEEQLPYCADDYDEQIDGVAEVFGMDALECDGQGRPLTDAEQAAYQSFLDGALFPSKTITLESFPRDLSEYGPEQLLWNSDIPRFLKYDSYIRELFENVYKDILHDLESYEEGARSATRGDLLKYRKNVFHLLLTVDENVPPLEHHVTGELGINTVTL